MNRRVPAYLALAVALLIGIAEAGAQSEPSSDVFVRTVPITKIFGHQFGYKIYYQKLDGKLHSFLAPNAWFVEAGGRGQVVWGTAREYPYFSVFWQDGQFELLRLYLRPVHDISWGLLRGGDEVRDSFDVSEPLLEF